MIAAIAIPNLLNAINRGRQKRTMADMRSIATAVESYEVDFNFYPKVATSAVFLTDLAPYLQPTYIKRLPTVDGWNDALNWLGDANNGTSYTLWSQGKGKTGKIGDGPGQTTDFGKAIIFSTGQFVTWPEGQQTN
ncbi:MAG TPA: type II secretion system protein GspG [Thermoanaerobaculaceae bacterium]|nr:type II secretion system protein GspG [Thermoanaerobaculaceae bacterium]